MSEGVTVGTWVQVGPSCFKKYSIMWVLLSISSNSPWCILRWHPWDLKLSKLHGNLQRCLKVIKQVIKPHKASPNRKDRKVSSLLNNFDGFPTSWNIDSTWMLNLAFSKRREICRATTYWLNDKATVRHCWHLLTFRGHSLGGQVQVPQGPWRFVSNKLICLICLT